MKPALLESCVHATVVKKDLRTIGVIKDEEPKKDSKYASRNSQAMASKGRERKNLLLKTSLNLST